MEKAVRILSNTIQPSYGTTTYSAPTTARETKQTGTQGSSFLDLAARASRNTTDVLEISSRPEVTNETDTSSVDAYKKHLENKYGQVTVQSVGKDQASLQKAGSRMNGSSVVIAPNILEDMANDPEKAAYYEKKIDDFFNATPKLKAQFAAQGLNYEPCGVVIHEDGSVTYIGGCGDSPERVAEVNRINAEKAKKKAEQQRQYQEQSAAAAAQRRAMWERTAETAALEKTFSNIGDLLKTRMVSAPTITPEVSLPAGTNMFFLDL